MRHSYNHEYFDPSRAIVINGSLMRPLSLPLLMPRLLSTSSSIEVVATVEARALSVASRRFVYNMSQMITWVVSLDSSYLHPSRRPSADVSTFAICLLVMSLIFLAGLCKVPALEKPFSQMFV